MLCASAAARRPTISVPPPRRLSDGRTSQPPPSRPIQPFVAPVSPLPPLARQAGNRRNYNSAPPANQPALISPVEICRRPVTVSAPVQASRQPSTSSRASQESGTASSSAGCPATPAWPVRAVALVSSQADAGPSSQDVRLVTIIGTSKESELAFRRQWIGWSLWLLPDRSGRRSIS